MPSAEIIPTKPCRPERRFQCSHAGLLALRAHGVAVFECAHDWVDDASIRHEVAHGLDHDLTQPHSHATDRAARIATMVRMMQRGVRFEPLFLRVTAEGGRLTGVHLADGHHRLRAVQWQAAFLNGSPTFACNVGGDLGAVALLRGLLAR